MRHLEQIYGEDSLCFATDDDSAMTDVVCIVVHRRRLNDKLLHKTRGTCSILVDVTVGSDSDIA